MKVTQFPHALAFLPLFKSIIATFRREKRQLSEIKETSLIHDICCSCLLQQSCSLFFFFPLDPAAKLFLPFNVAFSASLSAFLSIAAQTQHSHTSPCSQPWMLLLWSPRNVTTNPCSTFNPSSAGKLLNSSLLVI